MDHIAKHASVMVTKIVQYTLDEHPDASRWKMMALGLGKRVNKEMFHPSSPKRQSTQKLLDWTPMLLTRNVHIQDRPAHWSERQVILPIHRADLIFVVSNLPSCGLKVNDRARGLEVNAKRVRLSAANEWHAVDQKGSLHVDKERSVGAYSIDVTADGRIGVLAVMPDQDSDIDIVSSEDETIHIFDAHDMKEIRVIHTGSVFEDASTVKIDPSGCSVAVWQPRKQTIIIYNGREEKELTPQNPWYMHIALHWADNNTLRWLELDGEGLVLCMWKTVTQSLFEERMTRFWMNCRNPDIARPHGEAWYLSLKCLTKDTEEWKYYLLNLDTMEVTKTASTFCGLWNLPLCWEEGGNITLQGPYATIISQAEDDARDFTCKMRILDRPV